MNRERESLPRKALSAALGDMYDETVALAGEAEQMLHKSIQALKTRDCQLARSVVDFDDVVDQRAVGIETAAETIIARHQPVASDLRRIITTLRITRDLERIADLATNIAHVSLDMGTEPLLKPLIDIPRMAIIAQEMVRDSLTSLIEECPEAAREVALRDEEIDGLYSQIFRELLSYMIEDPRTIRRAIPLLFVARHLERVGDHATNIGQAVVYLLTGQRMLKPFARPEAERE